jgi:ribose 5-phosphate isomerase A
MQATSAQDEAKQAAAAKAIETFLRDGMTIGLGSGTTSRWFVRILGERVTSGLRVTGVPSSKSTGQLAQEVGVPLADLNEVAQLDLTIDGADEIDSKGRMIKGGGANLLWEKIVACASRRMVAIVDESKVVEQLGRFPLPIDVVPGEAPNGICRAYLRMRASPMSISMFAGAWKSCSSLTVDTISSIAICAPYQTPKVWQQN